MRIKTITIVVHNWGSGTILSTPRHEEIIKYWGGGGGGGEDMWQFERKDKSLLPSLSSQKWWKAATFIAGALLLSRPYATVVEWWFTKCESFHPPVELCTTYEQHVKTVWQKEGIAYMWVPWRILVQALRKESHTPSPYFWTKHFRHCGSFRKYKVLILEAFAKTKYLLWWNYSSKNKYLLWWYLPRTDILRVKPHSTDKNHSNYKYKFRIFTFVVPTHNIWCTR
jgi:hypothetical protein